MEYGNINWSMLLIIPSLKAFRLYYYSLAGFIFIIPVRPTWWVIILTASCRRVSPPSLSIDAVSARFHCQKSVKGTPQINSWHSNKYADLMTGSSCRCLFFSSTWCENGRENLINFPYLYTISSVFSFPLLCCSPTLKFRFSWCRLSVSSDSLGFNLPTKAERRKI